MTLCMCVCERLFSWHVFVRAAPSANPSRGIHIHVHTQEAATRKKAPTQKMVIIEMDSIPLQNTGLWKSGCASEPKSVLHATHVRHFLPRGTTATLWGPSLSCIIYWFRTRKHTQQQHWVYLRNSHDDRPGVNRAEDAHTHTRRIYRVREPKLHYPGVSERVRRRRQWHHWEQRRRRVCLFIDLAQLRRSNSITISHTHSSINVKKSTCRVLQVKVTLPKMDCKRGSPCSASASLSRFLHCLIY